MHCVILFRTLIIQVLAYITWPWEGNQILYIGPGEGWGRFYKCVACAAPWNVEQSNWWNFSVTVTYTFEGEQQQSRGGKIPQQSQIWELSFNYHDSAIINEQWNLIGRVFLPPGDSSVWAYLCIASLKQSVEIVHMVVIVRLAKVWLNYETVLACSMLEDTGQTAPCWVQGRVIIIKSCIIFMVLGIEVM